MSEKTHYRKAFNSPYLSSADIVEPTILTVSHVHLEKDATKKTKDKFNTAYFIEHEIRRGEKLKPMILNATNSRTLKDLTGSPFIEDWKNTSITVYVDNHVKMMGEVVDGLRISKEPPRLEKPAFDISTQLENGIAAYKRDGNFEKIEERCKLTEADKKTIMDGVE